MNQDLKTTSIKDIDTISVRAKNCLIDNNILTVQDLMNFCNIHGVERIVMFRNCGKKTLKEIYDFMSSFGLNTDISMQTDPKKLRIVDIPMFSTRTINILMCKEIFTLQDLLDYRNKYGINKIRQIFNAGDKTIKEINDFLATFDTPEEQQIRNLQSKIDGYKLSISRMEAELAMLKAKRKERNNISSGR